MSYITRISHLWIPFGSYATPTTNGSRITRLNSLWPPFGSYATPSPGTDDTPPGGLGGAAFTVLQFGPNNSNEL